MGYDVSQNDWSRVVISGMPFDLIELKEFDLLLTTRAPEKDFVYVVTPNVDHVVKSHKLSLSSVYEKAWLSVCDSKVLATLSKILGINFPSVITGSDLTKRLFECYLVAGDRVTIIGGGDNVINKLRSIYSNIFIDHYNPPMGFIGDEMEVEKAIRFVIEHPAKFVFFAVGAPQQELLASKIVGRGAQGIGLCIGASILFLVGEETRAPLWIQSIHMEWLYRLLQSPKRLWRRYLVDDPYIFYLILKQAFFKFVSNS